MWKTISWLIVMLAVSQVVSASVQDTARHSGNHACRAVSSDQRCHERDTHALDILWRSNKRPRVSDTIDRDTLNAALVFAGLDDAGLPITLTAVLPERASRGIEAWTTYTKDGAGERIFVYSGGEMFGCARWPLSMHQCRVRLASILVHEAWHLHHGPNETGAYEAQIAFLMRNGASVEHLKAVRMARDRVIAAQRHGADNTGR